MLEHPDGTLIPGPDKEGKESMDEAIRKPPTTSGRGTSSAGLPGEVFTRHVITVVLALITALTFAFGFGNVWALGRELGVPVLVAPLVGPAVDLSVAGLLIAIRHLSMAGVSRRELRPARVLLTACGGATLALNIAGPIAAGAYGRAAFDSVGPCLLVGWAETGPGLLRHLYAASLGYQLKRPSQAYGAQATLAEAAADRPVVPAKTRARGDQRSAGSRSRHPETTDEIGAFLVRARQIDQEHRAQHSRPVSAETLKKRMRIGSKRARTLVRLIRDRPDQSAEPLHNAGREAGTSVDTQAGSRAVERTEPIRTPVRGLTTAAR